MGVMGALGTEDKSITIQIVEITGASLTPNPTSINEVFQLSVTIVETTKTLEPEIWYSGELYAGEV